MTQARNSTKEIGHVASGRSEISFKNDQEAALQSVFTPKITVNNDNLTKALHELPKYNPTEKRKARYTTEKAD